MQEYGAKLFNFWLGNWHLAWKLAQRYISCLLFFDVAPGLKMITAVQFYSSGNDTIPALFRQHVTMNTLTVNAYFRKQFPKWILLKTAAVYVFSRGRRKRIL